MAFELKYKAKDTQNLVDIFANLSESNFNQDVIKTELEKLTKYPTNVIEEFLKCVKLLKEDDINAINMAAMQIANELKSIEFVL